MNAHVEAARDPEKHRDLNKRVMAAAGTPFDQLSRAEGMLLRSAFEAADLGIRFVDEPALEAAWSSWSRN